MRFILAILVCSLLAFNVEAGPFGLFGRRSSGCANGSCSMQTITQVVNPVVTAPVVCLPQFPEPLTRLPQFTLPEKTAAQSIELSPLLNPTGANCTNGSCQPSNGGLRFWRYV